MSEFIKVVAVQDEGCDWYIIPKELANLFHEECAWLQKNDPYQKSEEEKNIYYKREQEFVDLFHKYQTGGCLNNIQLYIKQS